MDKLSPDFDMTPDPRRADYGAQVADWLAGTYSAGWIRLMEASYSASYAALVGTSGDYSSWQRMKERGIPAGERDFLVNLNYVSATFGASLGAVILVAFAVESFMRLGYVVALENSRTRGQRQKGTNELLQGLLQAFDRAKTPERLSILRKKARFSFDQRIEAAVLALMIYRNEIAHDSPRLHRESGGSQKVYGERRHGIEPFESLRESHRPARLKHVIAAVQAHDRFVRNALLTSRLQSWPEELRHLGGAWTAIADFMPGTKWWSQTREFSKAWEAGPERNRATAVERHDFGLSLQRSNKVKLVSTREPR